MTDTFHGRSRESLIEEIKELREVNKALSSLVMIFKRHWDGETTRNLAVAEMSLLSVAMEETKL